jgi:hypothetical protein
MSSSLRRVIILQEVHLIQEDVPNS